MLGASASLVKRLEGDLHLQRCQIGVDVTGVLLQADAPSIVLVVASALHVLVREDDGLEVTRSGKRSGVQRGVARELGHRNLGKKLPNEIALDGIVIQENHGIEAERQLMGNRPDIRSLVVPICLENGNVLFFEQHLWMLAEWQASDFVVVLRGYGKHDTSFTQLQGEPLGSKESFASRVALRTLDTFESVVTDHTAPNRIVQVENQHAPAPASPSRKQPRDVLGVKRQIAIGEWQLREVPFRR